MKPGYGFREEKKDYLSVQFNCPDNPERNERDIDMQLFLRRVSAARQIDGLASNQLLT